MAALWLQSVSLLVLLVVLWPGSQAAPQPQPLCGSELVDALYLICGDRGFVYTLTPRQAELAFKDQVGMRPQLSVVEQCCHRPCTIAVMENFCR